MSLLDGDKPSSLPSLSWDSVVGDTPSKQPSPDDGGHSDQPAPSSPPASPPASTAPTDSMAPPVPPPPAPVAAPAPPAASEDPTGPIHLDVPTEPAPTAGVAEGLLSITPPEPITGQASTPATTTSATAGVATGGLASFQMSLDRSIGTTPEPAARGVEPPTITTPSIDTPISTEPAAAPAPTYAPVPDAAPAPAAAVAPTHAAPEMAPVVPQPAAAPAPQVQAPAPTVPAYSLPPTQARAVPVATVGGQQLSYDAAPARSRKRRQHHHRGGGGLGLLLTLLVLGGLIAAAFVYGRPYLFPDDWDETTKPYAEAVETVRGETIVEPFSVIDDELAVYNAAFDADYFGEWQADTAMWRAFGLADGAANEATLPGLVTERPDVYYSLTDRQVHRVAMADPTALDSATTAAVAAAVLDQEYRWTLLLGESTIERDAVVRALVAAEADRIQAATELGEPAAPPATAQVGLPVVLDHRLVAPALYTAVIGQPQVGDESRLAALETFAAEMSGSTELPLGTPPVLGEGEASAGTARPMDRSFWYLVFASRMDAATAHDLSQAVQSASLSAVRTAELTTCWSAVFDVATPELGASLTASLSTWAAGAPAEAAATVTALSETSVQMRVCDPGIATATTNPGAARSLLGYRAAELAVIAGVVERGGGVLEIDAGLALLSQSTVGDELAAVAGGAEIEALAAEARGRVVAIVDAATAGLPAQAPAVEPAPVVSEQPPAPTDG